MADYIFDLSGDEITKRLRDIPNKVDKVNGKGLSTEDFTSELLAKLKSLSNYNDTELREAIAKLRTSLDTLVDGDTSSAIQSFNEIVAFLKGVEDNESLEGIIAAIEQQIAGKQDAITDLDAIRRGAGKGNTSVQTIIINGKSKTPDAGGNLNIGDMKSYNIYITDFDMVDVRGLVSGDAEAVAFSAKLFEAVMANKVILIPAVVGEPNGYYLATNANYYADDVELYLTISDVGWDIKLFGIFNAGTVLTSKNVVLTPKQKPITDIDTLRYGASRGATSVQGVKLNGDTITRKDENGIVDLGNIEGDGGNVSFIDNNSLQGLPFGYIGGYYRSYEFDGTSSAEVNLGYIDSYYIDTIVIAHNDVLYEESIRRLKGDGKRLGTVVVRVDDSYNLYARQLAPKKSTFGWRIYTDKQLMPDSWVNLENYYTKSAAAQLKSDIINGYLNVKPTVRIFHSTDPNNSSIYAYHPYLNEFGDGELVVMRYGKTKMAKWILDGDNRSRKYVTKTGWRECLGAPIDLKYYVGSAWQYARFTEPAKLYVGKNGYMNVLEEICERATYDKINLVSDDGVEYEGLASMAQLMALYNTTAMHILQNKFYDQWENYYVGDTDTAPGYSIFGGTRDRVTLGVALRVLNPEFQKLLDEGILDTAQFNRRRWYYDEDKDITIPKYLYSDVCEMYLSKGSMREMVSSNLPRAPRLSLKG